MPRFCWVMPPNQTIPETFFTMYEGQMPPQTWVKATCKEIAHSYNVALEQGSVRLLPFVPLEAVK